MLYEDSPFDYFLEYSSNNEMNLENISSFIKSIDDINKNYKFGNFFMEFCSTTYISIETLKIFKPMNIDINGLVFYDGIPFNPLIRLLINPKINIEILDYYLNNFSENRKYFYHCLLNLMYIGSFELFEYFLYNYIPNYLDYIKIELIVEGISYHSTINNLFLNKMEVLLPYFQIEMFSVYKKSIYYQNICDFYSSYYICK
jgi:hypothetical protein